MEAARTRIRSIRMKNGGPDLRVINPSPVNDVVKHAIDWGRELPKWGEQPSAVVMVTWWRSSDGKDWNPPHTVDWITRDPDLPMSRLFAVTAAKIADHGAALEGKHRALLEMGAVDPEDDAG